MLFRSIGSKVQFRVVLRRKPQHIAHPSAHALHREYRVLNALQKHNQLKRDACVPVPKPYAYCDDESVIGTEFYLMQFVQGK